LKNTFLKTLPLAIFCSLSFQHSFANVNEDSTKNKKPLLASVKERNTKILKQANVQYPQILSGAEEGSIDYVEKFSANRKDYLIRTFNRSKKYFPKAIAILKKQNIPAEFAVLMALESGFNGNAVSRAGAVGYWQIMDEVAKEYGLRIPQKQAVILKKDKRNSPKNKKIAKAKKQVDDRKDFVRSTYAAAKYLRDRHRNLNGDWLLITASYNCGVGNVWDAMERSGKANPDFWDIKNYLPAETRAYVMNFIALNVIFSNYEKFMHNDLCFKDVVVKKEDLDD
jgi:membrane-bound lytic murein transglycosylase D